LFFENEYEKKKENKNFKDKFEKTSSKYLQAGDQVT